MTERSAVELYDRPEYVTVRADLLATPEKLLPILDAALAYVTSLAPKQTRRT